MDPCVTGELTDRHAAGRTAAGDATERIPERPWIRARTDRPDGAVPRFDERRAAIGRANRNAIGRGAAGHAVEGAGARARTRSHRPRYPVPRFGQCLFGAMVDGPAHGHAAGRGGTGHTVQVGAVTGTRTGGYEPAGAVPDLGQRAVRHVSAM